MWGGRGIYSDQNRIMDCPAKLLKAAGQCLPATPSTWNGIRIPTCWIFPEQTAVSNVAFHHLNRSAAGSVHN